MAKLLYVEASPRKQRSKSIHVAQAFLDTYRESHPQDEVLALDLWEKPLPEFDGETLDAKYAVLHGQAHSPEQATAWQAVVDVCDEFKSADKYLFSLPMWNFSIPYKLKHYIDVLAQPGQTFSFDPETGYSGLVTGRPAAVVYARGGTYGSGDAQAMDMQKGYLDLLLGFIGIKDVQSVLVEPTLADAEEVTATETRAVAEACRIAATF